MASDCGFRQTDNLTYETHIQTYFPDAETMLTKYSQYIVNTAVLLIQNGLSMQGSHDPLRSWNSVFSETITFGCNTLRLSPISSQVIEDDHAGWSLKMKIRL